MLGMTWVGEDGEEVGVNVRTAAVLRRTGPRAVGAARSGDVVADNGLEGQLMRPIIAEVVQVKD